MAQLRHNSLLSRAGLSISRPVLLVACASIALIGGYGIATNMKRDSFSIIENHDVNVDETQTNDEQQANKDHNVIQEREDSKGLAQEPQSSLDLENYSQNIVVVHVDGAVESPGVYTLEGETIRVTDACDAAGGILPDADTSAINLAAPVIDGIKIYVPYEGEEFDQNSSSNTENSYAGNYLNTQTSITNGLVNINTAGIDELVSLSGIGEKTAEAIVQERERNGVFVSIEDIMRVSGIGEKKFERIKNDICV